MLRTKHSTGRGSLPAQLSQQAVPYILPWAQLWGHLTFYRLSGSSSPRPAESLSPSHTPARQIQTSTLLGCPEDREEGTKPAWQAGEEELVQLCCPPCPYCSLSVTECSTSRREFYPAMEALLRKERKEDRAGKGAQHLHLLAIPPLIWKALAPSVAASKETRPLEAARDTRYWRRGCSDQLAAHLRRHRIKHNLGNKPGQIWASAQLSRKGV